ncbi:hemicentin-2-like isoform X2 [Micropterus dolomieu]|nr:hemicentin-2-like isoform X2 [Micropterus dolomieu]XP_045888390.1 hemicentin-2-like isoform X2 [Micropterus dolomieu]
MHASVPESMFDGMGWEAPGGTGIVKNVRSLNWTPKTLTEWDIKPQCYFNPLNDSLKQCFKDLIIVIYTFPETIRISSSSGSDGVMKEKEDYNITCDIHNIAPVQNLTVKWYKGDVIVRTDTFDNPSKKPVNQSSVLNFTPTRQDDRVTFRCEAHLNLGPEEPQYNVSSQEYNITVHFGPDVPCSSSALLEGETLEKLCNVTGNPKPIVKWLKDKKLTDPTVPLSRENAGLYTIEANGLSSIQKELLVTVLYGPELMCPSTYTGMEYAPHNFTCIVKGYPKPKTVWYKDGEEVEEFPEKFTRRDAGQYLITASNNLTSVNITVEINVIYPPSQIVELEDSEVNLGSTVSLKCSSTGNPRPKYFWNYYRTANVMEENEDGVSRLNIRNATAYNMGSYTCHATNDRGNVSKTARVTVKGAEQECPIEITPDTMVIQYQSRDQNATCKSTSAGSKNLQEIYWRGRPDVKSKIWLVDTNKGWDVTPLCIANFTGIGQCQKNLSITLYKTPDSVSIHRVDNVSSVVVEERELQLQCDITNVAPAQNLTVLWYQGNETFKPLVTGPMKVTSCPHENSTNCDVNVIRSPVNVSSTISITLNRKHKGAEFRCEAHLDLGPEGPQPPPNMMSSPLNITVYYKPVINTTKLPKTIPVFRGYPEELVCESEGHPPPKIQWHYSSDKQPHVTGDTLIVSEAGLYNCSATNDVGSVSREVEVILKGKHVSSSCLEMSPPRVVVRFGDSFSVNCSSKIKASGMGWESSNGGIPLRENATFLTLKATAVKEWDLNPICFINPFGSDNKQCLESLPVTVYKMPDSVSMSHLSQMVPMVEGQTYLMQCDIVNVAPVRNLSVNWHKGNKVFYTQTFDESHLTPVNKTSVYSLTAHRDDNGAQIWCEAKLKFEPTAPNPPAIQSNSHEMNVQYPPTFTGPANETLELPDRSKMILNCTATGNPMPAYSWHVPHPIQQSKEDQNENQPILTLSIQLPGTYNCTVANIRGTKTKYFTVIKATRDQTTFAALVGVFVALGVLLLIGGAFFVTPEGTFSFSRGGYLRGHPASSGPHSPARVNT